MANVTILDLIRNGTLSADMAGLLWEAVDEKLSFLTVALPRLAGKSTVSNAVLALRKPDVLLHPIYGDPRQTEALKRDHLGGYLVVNEFSQAPLPGYLWGEPVRRVFETLPAGYSLQTSLHARSVPEAIEVVTRGNGVSDEDASVFKLVLYIERFGGPGDYWRRLVELYELHTVEGGKPVGHPLFRWQAATDSFEQVSEPHQFGDAARLRDRVGLLERLAADPGIGEKELLQAVHSWIPASR